MKPRVICLYVLLAVAAVACGRSMQHGPSVVAAPVPDGAQFNNLFQDEGMYFSGQPTEVGLEEMAAAGVTTVINLRADGEMAEKVPFDESAVVERLGMKYVHLPFTSETFGPSLVEQVADAIDGSDGKMLLHCASSNRVGAMWASYLNRRRDVGLDEAVERGKAVGLRSEALEGMVRNLGGEPVAATASAH
jgi:uncharacterized protein (TIGR01244 family)